MTSNEIRKSFLEFFRSKEHRLVPSAPVVPHDDPTLLFTNAGMNQFKDVFLGTGKRDYSRAADTQKCIRVSGKHNDLEEVGVDTYHHTFFEMLGNWSFGDYYKEEAIAWAWELLTEIWKLPKDRLYATVFRTDDEAFEIWKKYLPADRIQRFDEKDNFWEMGETGPCGPCSEIHFDRTPDRSGAPLVNSGVPEVIEIWNLVFIQYNRKIDGTLEPLANKHVDTGMGFERVSAVIQGKFSNYDTDVFSPILNKIEELSGKKYNPDLKDKDGIAMRVIADHIRSLSFAIADGAHPGNEGRGYVLRRILRRAARFCRNLGFKEAVLYKIVPTLVENMGEVFPELKTNQEIITKVIRGEEESFLSTLDRGLKIFEDITKEMQEDNSVIISGENAFLLYDTFGFPLDLTELIARERGLTVDTIKFDQLMRQQKERARSARRQHLEEVEKEQIDFKSQFVGYDQVEAEGKALYIKGNKIVLDKTPFYAESGGQISDIGILILGGHKYNVVDVKKQGDAIVHYTDEELEPLQGSSVMAKVDATRRRDIMRNHSATHLFHEALRRVLGPHVKQAGSLVAPDYLRFDFNHFEKVMPGQLQEIEDIVNEKILDGIKVKTDVLSLEEARQNPKIKMFFGDKYGDTVRALTMDPEYSIELCGGTHVTNTSEIGFFKIVSESSVAAGVRRIEAVTGKGVKDYIRNLSKTIEEKELEKEQLQDRIRQLEKTIASLKLQNLSSTLKELVDRARVVNGVRIVADMVSAGNIDELRNLADELRNELGKNGVGLLAIEMEGKAQLACVVTDDLKDKAPAGKLIGIAAKRLGGGGGGKPHLATAGAKDVEKLPDLIKEFPELVKEFL